MIRNTTPLCTNRFLTDDIACLMSRWYRAISHKGNLSTMETPSENTRINSQSIRVRECKVEYSVQKPYDAKKVCL